MSQEQVTSRELSLAHATGEGLLLRMGPLVAAQVLQASKRPRASVAHEEPGLAQRRGAVGSEFSRDFLFQVQRRVRGRVHVHVHVHVDVDIFVDIFG
ncbi:hypothetical protein QG37_00247 [Candidozyma auris]|uniref:Uncharacterized protein n=1 Tax=Candidozyma auris TaxID=498019 RepID=A0A0L0P7Y3_CANAR|nr:hypothetical protein QG37_00247 [[Candida] auris]